ncbi:hypothetical protein DRP07_02170 [Archaeoglobales archaeon]|nr:MAG: hypothetical protein DRP07_02170 [Archaeoglobales archaeon]
MFLVLIIQNEYQPKLEKYIERVNYELFDDYDEAVKRASHIWLNDLDEGDAVFVVECFAAFVPDRQTPTKYLVK